MRSSYRPHCASCSSFCHSSVPCGSLGPKLARTFSRTSLKKMTHICIWRNHCLCGDLIYCQRLRLSAAGRTTAYHVGTRRRRCFLFSVGPKLTSRTGEKSHLSRMRMCYLYTIMIVSGHSRLPLQSHCSNPVIKRTTEVYRNLQRRH